jgi:hypothetical protein
MTNLRSLDERLSVLESDSFYESVKKRKEIEVQKKVDEEMERQMRLRKVNRNNVIDVIEFVVDFVEVLANYVPEIVALVGGAFRGEYKLVTAMRLITKIIGDVSGAFGTKDLESTVNKMVELKYNKEGKIESVEAEVKKDGGKKLKKNTGCFHFRFGTNGRKTSPSD